MSLPTLGAEAALYKSSVHYRAAVSWTDGVDIQVGLSQAGAPALGGTPIICDGSCPPPHCTHHCGPYVANPAEPTGCADLHDLLSGHRLRHVV